MNAQELVQFLKLLRNCGCLSQYWKGRINEVITKIGGNT